MNYKREWKLTSRHPTPIRKHILHRNRPRNPLILQHKIISTQIHHFVFQSKPVWFTTLTPRTLILNKGPWLKGPKVCNLGWFNGNYRGYEYFEHSGGLEAFGAQFSEYTSVSWYESSLRYTGMMYQYSYQPLDTAYQLWKHRHDFQLRTPSINLAAHRRQAKRPSLWAV